MPKIRAVIFDMDGTLIDSLGDIARAVNHVRGQRGLGPVSAKEIRKAVGHGAEHLIRESIPEVPAGEVRDVAKKYILSYLALESPGTRPYAGVFHALTKMQEQGLKLGIATNKASVSAEAAAKEYFPGIDFEVIAGPERVSARKPDPAHLLEPLKEMEVDPSEAIFVGDDPVDLECAKAAGVRFVGAAYGIGGVEAGLPKQDCIEALAELLERI